MDKQTITGNGGASYTLTHAVANAQEIEVFVNNVRQEPGVAYTVADNALTMTGNVASSDDFYVIYQGKALQTIVPPDGSVTTAKLGDDSVTKDKIGTTELDLATIKDSSGSNTAITIDSAGRVVISQRPYVSVDFGAGGSGAYATMSVGRMQFSNVADGDASLWSTTNYEFTCPVNGLYMVSHSGLIDGDENHEIQVYRGRSGTNSIQARFFEVHRVNRGSVLLSCLANDIIFWQNNNGADFFTGSGASRYTFGTIGLVR